MLLQVIKGTQSQQHEVILEYLAREASYPDSLDIAQLCLSILALHVVAVTDICNSSDIAIILAYNPLEWSQSILEIALLYQDGAEGDLDLKALAVLNECNHIARKKPNALLLQTLGERQVESVLLIMGKTVVRESR